MSAWALFWLLAQTAPASAAPPAPAPPPPPPPPRSAAPPRPASPLPPSVSPFRLSLTYVHVLREDGDLVDPNTSTNAVGVDLAFPSNTYVRNHLGLAHEWQSLNGMTARGFR